MSQGTRFTGDYAITAVTPTTSNVDMTMHTLTVHGNLIVKGNVSEYSSNNTSISDNFITLNAGENGAGVSSGLKGQTAGIEVDRGTLPTTAIRWNEVTLKWELTNDGSTYVGISTLTSSGGSFQLIDDPAPQLGGNLDVLGRSIFSSNNECVVFSQSSATLPGGPWGTGVAIENTTVAPGFKTGHTVIYAQPPLSGGSGLYVTTSSTVNDELATRTRALLYAYIL